MVAPKKSESAIPVVQCFSTAQKMAQGDGAAPWPVAASLRPNGITIQKRRYGLMKMIAGF